MKNSNINTLEALLRFSTAGSVDDGKSTLIGRLLYDSKAIFQDQLDAVEVSSRNSGEEELNLALLMDGLKAEREQKITIDVAYRYFATPKRKFIIADTPGHIQYYSKHGNRCFNSRLNYCFDRCTERCFDAIQAPRIHRLPPSDPTYGGGG